MANDHKSVHQAATPTNGQPSMICQYTLCRQMWNHLCFAIVQCVATIAVCSATVSGASPDAGDWPWWRGPNFNGVAAEGQNVPREWSDSQNVAWKVSIPGRGHASPTVVGDRIYLATADEGAQRQGVLCLSRKDGTQLWITPLSQGGFRKLIPKTRTRPPPSPVTASGCS